MNFVLQMNNRIGQRPWQSDYGDAQDYVRNFLETLNDESVRCNIIVNTHIAFIGPDEGVQGAVQGYPNAIGKALSPEIGRYFGSILWAKTVGKSHKLVTLSNSGVELKTSDPTRAKAEYPIETGLADYFRDIQQGSGAQ
jgi:hypothetical protein